MKGKETKHSKAFLVSKLKSGETVVGHLEGWIGEMMGSDDKTQYNGQFILTNMRVCFYRKGILGEIFETIPLEKITSVETLSRMGYRVIRLHTSHDELAFKTFESKEDFDRIYGHLESSRNTPPSSTQSKSTSTSIPEQIRQLAELRDTGILTEEEFVAKKTHLLQQM